MHQITQELPLIEILKVGQVMGAYTVVRLIEKANENEVRNICVRFYALSNGTDIWISGESLNNCGTMQGYLEEVVKLDRVTSEELSKSYEITATDGDCLELCFVKNKFDFEKFGMITCALEDFASEVVYAAGKVGVPLDQIGNSYKGEYPSFKAFVTEIWDELNLMSIPEEFRCYIDYDKIVTDWELEGEYAYESGFVFGPY